MNYKKTLFITQAAMIASLYTVLVIIFKPISFSDVQVRIAEALTILPFFTPAAIPGVAIGCFISGIVTGANIFDIVFGSLASLIAAVLTYQLRRHKFLVPVPPILVNAIVIPWVLRYAYEVPLPIPFMMLTVGIGEVLACGVLGLCLLFALEKVKHIVFKN